MQHNNQSLVAPEFEEGAWRVRCEDMAKEASRCCGASHDHYVTLFSEDIDNAIKQLSDNHQSLVIEIAKDWDYASVDEREKQQQWLSEIGCCTHGIELGCCPAGCGS